ncbi:MAG: hypothetical protein ABSG99_07525 [Sedimentisphaerales bacterium]
MTIGQFLNYLNQNQGALLTLLTSVYVLSSIITVIFIARSNKLARVAIGQSVIFEKERNRPYVIFDLIITNDSCIHAVVKNIGKLPALNIVIKSEPELFKTLGKENEITSFLQNKIPFLPPDRELKDFIGLSWEFLKKYSETNFQIKISYENPLNEKYNEISVLSLGFLKGTGSARPEDPIKKIESHLGEIEKQLHDISASQREIVWIQNSLFEKAASEEYSDVSLSNIDLSHEEAKYFSEIMSDPYEKKVYMNFLTSHQTKENERYYEMLKKFVNLGLLRRERNYWCPTIKGFDFYESKRIEPKSDMG